MLFQLIITTSMTPDANELTVEPAIYNVYYAAISRTRIPATEYIGQNETVFAEW